MQTILVTGANGQLGTELQTVSGMLNPDHKIVFTDVDELDVTNRAQTLTYIRNLKPRIIINCAAYNAVDQAETDKETAFAINAHAVKNLAEGSNETGCWFIHISTDYVFDGNNHVPYTENDVPRPLSAYARSKYEGEKYALAGAAHVLIIRTSWLYSAHGRNFVKTILHHAFSKPELRVVNDQIGTPTCAQDLANTIVALIRGKNRIAKKEILHFSNEGVASWYDFAMAVVTYAQADCKIIPVGTKDYPLPAIRPFYSVMNKEKIRKILGLDIPHWQNSLYQCMKEIMQSEK